MKRKHLALVAAGLILFVAAPCVQADGWEPWSRLEGAWLRTTIDTLDDGTEVQGVSGIYTISPKGPFAREAAVRLTFLNPDQTLVAFLAPGGGYVTDAVGEAVLTGPNTIEATAYAYIMANQPFPARAAVAGILVGVSQGTINGDVIEGIQIGYVYLASQDTDGDLIPDTGDPIVTITQPLTDRRAPMVPFE